MPKNLNFLVVFTINTYFRFHKPIICSSMNSQNKNFCVILAGGRGRRLWPCSRESKPKQFLDFFGMGHTQLQQTYDRFVKILPKENILVSTNNAYAHFVKEQLPMLSDDNLLSEPVHRNTAPSVTWAVCSVLNRCPDANLVVTPSDQAVFNEKAFATNVVEGLDFVAGHDRIVALGVKPTRPEPGYGYIQMGNDSDVKDIYKVKSFTEKPEREFAKMFMESNEFYWNTGVFISSACYMRTLLYSIFSHKNDKSDLSIPNVSLKDELKFVQDNFAAFPNISIDYAVLEKSDSVYLMVSDFGWADLGTWHGIYEALEKNEGGNLAVDSDVTFDNSTNNIVKIPKERMAVISGLSGYIVAEHDNVLFICRKEDSSALVRKYVNEMQVKHGDEYV